MNIWKVELTLDIYTDNGKELALKEKESFSTRFECMMDTHNWHASTDKTGSWYWYSENHKYDSYPDEIRLRYLHFGEAIRAELGLDHEPTEVELKDIETRMKKAMLSRLIEDKNKYLDSYKEKISCLKHDLALDTDIKWIAETNTWSDDWHGELHDTKEDAIEEGKKLALEENATWFRLGKAKLTPVTEFGVDADSIIERVQDQAYSEVGEYAEDYLEGIPGEQVLELESKLNEVFFDWVVEHGYQPTFYSILSSEVISVK